MSKNHLVEAVRKGHRRCASDSPSDHVVRQLDLTSLLHSFEEHVQQLADSVQSPTEQLQVPVVNDSTGLSPQSSFRKSMDEYKAKSADMLREELLRVEEELRLKDEQVVKLSAVRDELSAELEDLTSALFEEANKMVHSANKARHEAEKKLIETQQAVDVLQVELKTLKAVLDNPSKLRKHMKYHPDRLMSPLSGNHRASSEIRLNTLGVVDNSKAKKHGNQNKRSDFLESLDVKDFHEFQVWRDQPSMQISHPYIALLVQRDIRFALHFGDNQLAETLIQSALNDELQLELLSRDKICVTTCHVTNTVRLCEFKLSIPSCEHWIVCRMVRTRVAAVCELLTHLRYISLGIVKADAIELYHRTNELCRAIALARLGYL